MQEHLQEQEAGEIIIEDLKNNDLPEHGTNL